MATLGGSARGTTLDELLNQWLAAQTNIQTWTADFVQTRHLKALVQPLHAEGHLWYTAPSDFRWELGKPVQTVAARHGDELLLVYPNLKRAERYSFGGKQPGQLKDMLSLLEAGFPRSREQIEERFNLKLGVATNGCESMVLEPKTSATRKLLPQITVVIETNHFHLQATELQFADGSILRNDFTTSQVNIPIPSEIYQPALGPEFKITEPLKH
jgi:outer membrane lipoprotein-sorting protein